MLIQKKLIVDLIPFKGNPRKEIKPGDPVYEQIKASIERFGLVDPLIWNERTGYLIGGHQRLKVLKDLGYTEVDVSVVNFSPERELEIVIALNKIGNSFDDDMLARMIEQITQCDDFSPEAIGFNWEEITSITDAPNQVLEDDVFDEDKELDAIVEPITKPGDLVQLGPHKLLCGDCAKEDDLVKLLGDERIECCHQDPPYRVAYTGNTGPKNPSGKQRSWNSIKNDSLSPEEYSSWLKGVVSTQRKFLKVGASVCTWNGYANFGLMADIFKTEGIHVSNLIVWVKPTACPSFADYWFGAEFMLYGWVAGDKPHRWYGPRGESNIWHVDRDPVRNYEHPTAKPLELARRVLKNSTVRKDIVFDGFTGSGFNLIACQQMDRVFRGIELEPAYVDVSARRYIRLFGENSVSADVFQRYGKKEVVK